MLMRTLDHGLGSCDAEMAGHSLEGLFALTAWHVEEQRAGRAGLSPHTAPGALASLARALP